MRSSGRASRARVRRCRYRCTAGEPRHSTTKAGSLLWLPMPPDRLDDVRALLRTHMADEAQAGFPNLSRIPNSSMIRLLDYVSILTAADRDSLLDTLALLGALR